MTVRTIAPLRDRELLELLGEEPELLAIADALVATAPVVRRPRPAETLAISGAVVAAAIAALVLLWPFGSSPSVLENALAAIGSRPITHVVLESDLGSFWLDLRTGKRTPTSGRQEYWYQPGRGLLMQWTFPGARPQREFLPWTPPGGGPRINLGGSALGLYVTRFVISYRDALRQHAFHVVGTGTIGSVPVYWISSTPAYIGRDPERKRVEQVAISKATYEPLYVRFLFNDRVIPGSSVRVLSAGTTDNRPAGFQSRHQTSTGFGWQLGYTEIPLAQARLRPFLPRQVAGIRLSWTGDTPFVAGPNGVTIPGRCLYYGPVDRTGLPDADQPAFRGRYVEIVEFPSANPLTRFYGGRFPSDGRILIDGLTAQGPVVADLAVHVATLRAHGTYFLIQASDARLAVAAARAVG